MQKCKTCGRQFTAVQTMTYSDYGYCSWECLMNKNKPHSAQTRSNRRNNGQRNDAHPRSKWAQSY